MINRNRRQRSRLLWDVFPFFDVLVQKDLRSPEGACGFFCRPVTDAVAATALHCGTSKQAQRHRIPFLLVSRRGSDQYIALENTCCDVTGKGAWSKEHKAVLYTKMLVQMARA